MLQDVVFLAIHAALLVLVNHAAGLNVKQKELMLCSSIRDTEQGAMGSECAFRRLVAKRAGLGRRKA